MLDEYVSGSCQMGMLDFNLDCQWQLTWMLGSDLGLENTLQMNLKIHP